MSVFMIPLSYLTLPPPPLSTQEKYTVWDFLTSSLCAIMNDNQPRELLNNPLLIAPEVSPSEKVRGNNNTSSSPVWMGNAHAEAHADARAHARETSSEVGGVRCEPCYLVYRPYSRRFLFVFYLFFVGRLLYIIAW